jgi:pyroglutamyl-peptidase
VREVVRHLRSADIPAAESLSAGTFLCNHVLYAGLHHAARTGASYRAGFIHLPPLPEQADGGPSLPLDVQVRGVRLALQLLARTGAKTGA